MFNLKEDYYLSGYAVVRWYISFSFFLLSLKAIKALSLIFPILNHLTFFLYLLMVMTSPPGHLRTIVPESLTFLGFV